MLSIAMIVVCAIVVVGAVVARRASAAAAALADVIEYAEVIKADLASADLDALADDLGTLDDRTQSLLTAVSDPVLSAGVDGIPYAGAHLRAARTVASAIAGLTAAARPLSTVLPALEPEQLVVDGVYDTDTLSEFDGTIRDVEDQLSISTKQLASIDTDALDARFAKAVDSVASALDSADTLVGQIEPLVGILPILLDQSESHDWMVVLQNLAEARGTGGILGAYAVLHVEGGSLSMISHGSDRDLISTAVPSDGVSDDLKALWGGSIDDIRSVNVSPNFPYAGQLWANGLEAATGQSVDGVLAFGQGIVQYLLAATGPVTIEGQTIDAENVVSFLSLGVYAQFPDATDKNAFVSELVAEIFSRLQAGQFDLPSLLSATATTTTSDRLLAWSPVADIESSIEAAGYAGELSTDYGPDVAVAVNNGSGNKLEQFLHVDVDYALGTCDEEYLRQGSVEITLTNEAPTSGLPAYVTPRLDRSDAPVGSTLEIVSVYAPVGSGNPDETLDGEDVEGYVGTETGRPLYVFTVDLDPGQSRTLVLNWLEPTAGPTVADVLSTTPQVTVPPTLVPWTVTAEEAAQCG
ncbi:MAG: DUF4012 domain-containing protein [Microbacteriaceae bacterium]